MDFTAITQVVSALGFPIVACFFLFRSNEKMQQAHKEESTKFTEALHKNTLVLQKLCDALGISREDSEE